MSQCRDCIWIDDSDSSGSRSDAGTCGKLENFFEGRHVPTWLQGCPDYEPISHPDHCLCDSCVCPCHGERICKHAGWRRR